MKHMTSEPCKKTPQEFLSPTVEVIYFAAEEDVICTSDIELPADPFDNP